MKLALIGMISVGLLFQIVAGTYDESIPVCLSNCIQCKKMFGRYFQGRTCGNDCIASNGLAVPDCNNPGTLRSYLKRLL